MAGTPTSSVFSSLLEVGRVAGVVGAVGDLKGVLKAGLLPAGFEGSTVAGLEMTSCFTGDGVGGVFVSLGVASSSSFNEIDSEGAGFSSSCEADRGFLKPITDGALLLRIFDKRRMTL